MLTSKVGMSAKSSDAETDELVRKFTGLEGYTDKLVKDTTTFKDAVLSEFPPWRLGRRAGGCVSR